MRPVSRNISNMQRAQISASKRYDKDTNRDDWEKWVKIYLNFLETQAIPAQEIGQYIRLRPKDFEPVAAN